jgi:hypothetical protein
MRYTVLKALNTRIMFKNIETEKCDNNKYSISEQKLHAFLRYYRGNMRQLF